MDLATVIGFVLGIVFFLLGVLNGGQLGAFIDITSIFIVIGGSLGALMIKHPLAQVTGVVSVIMKAFFAKEQNSAEIVKQMVQFAESARKEGLLVLEKATKELDDPFMKSGLQLAVDGTEPEILQILLEKEIENLETRHKKGQDFMSAWAELAPAWGMIGTLVGLVNMLLNMSDPSSIGPAMAVALLTTLYGALIANLICNPIAGKLEIRSKEEILMMNMVMDGILSIQAGDNPALVEFKLNTYLSRLNRENEDEE
jgi:chemotaxis protein MotA